MTDAKLKPNKGRLPRGLVIRDDEGEVSGYHLVHVVLFNGYSTKKAGAAPWPAGGKRPPTNWGISHPPHPFEIEFYERA